MKTVKSFLTEAPLNLSKYKVYTLSYAIFDSTYNEFFAFDGTPSELNAIFANGKVMKSFTPDFTYKSNGHGQTVKIGTKSITTFNPFICAVQDPNENIAIHGKLKALQEKLKANTSDKVKLDADAEKFLKRNFLMIIIQDETKVVSR